MIIQEYITTFRFAWRHEQYFGFVKAIRDTKKALREMGVLGTAYAVGGLGLVSYALADLGYDAAKVIDTLGDMGEKLNLSAQEMQEWHFAAQQAAVDLSSFEVAIKQFARNVGDAAKGKAPQMLERFVELGERIGKTGQQMVSENGQARPWADVLLDMADAYAKMAKEGKSAEQLAVSLKLQGRAGEELVQLLNLGSVRIREMFEQAKEFGHVITEEERKRADAIIKQWDFIKFRFKGLMMEVGARFFPLIEWVFDKLEGIADGLMKTAKSASAFVEELKSIGVTIQRVAFALGFTLLPLILYKLIPAVAGLALHVKALLLTVGVFSGGGVLTGLKAVAAAFGSMALKVLVVLAAVALLYLLFDDIATYFQGGGDNTLMGQVYKWFNDIDPEDNPLLNGMKMILQTIGLLTNAIIALFTLDWDLFATNMQDYISNWVKVGSWLPATLIEKGSGKNVDTKKMWRDINNSNMGEYFVPTSADFAGLGGKIGAGLSQGVGYGMSGTISPIYNVTVNAPNANPATVTNATMKGVEQANSTLPATLEAVR